MSGSPHHPPVLVAVAAAPPAEDDPSQQCQHIEGPSPAALPVAAPRKDLQDWDQQQNEGHCQAPEQQETACPLPDSTISSQVVPPVVPPRWHKGTPLYTTQQFQRLWEQAESGFAKVEEVENRPEFRKANHKVKGSVMQNSAQYGRLLPEAAEKVFEHLELGRDDVFVDFGHGIGQLVMQASYTCGCECRGIEVVKERNDVANQYLQELRKKHRERSASEQKPGWIELKHGRLECSSHRDFLTQVRYADSASTGNMKVVVNNFNYAFADRSAKSDVQYDLDQIICGLFGLMKPGAKLLAFHALGMPILPFSEAEAYRKKHRLPVDANASFYEMQEVEIGEANRTVSWSSSSSTKIKGYLYTRLSQQNDNAGAVFLCSNKECEDAQKGTKTIEASKEVVIEGHRRGGCSVVEHCPVPNFCKCKSSDRQSRGRTASKSRRNQDDADD